MALTPLTERQKTLIVNNIVAACSDIENLNSTGYKFINQACGFIAHYNLNGFKDFYCDYSLRDDILDNAQSNQWNNFHPNDRDYEYMMAKKDVYNRIVARIR